MSYLIKPTNVITGAKAPGIMSFAEKKEEAVYDAMKRSALSRYERWSFTFDVEHIKDKAVKKRRSDESD
jgi:hypothetical protein